MTDLFEIRLSRIAKSQTKHTLPAIYDIVFHHLYSAVGTYCGLKENRWALEYLSEVKLDGPLILDDRVYVDLKNSGGMCTASSAACRHWLQILYRAMHPQLNKKVKTYGYRLAHPETTLEALAESNEEPLVAVKGELYVYRHDVAGGIQLEGDDKTVNVTSLASATAARVRRLAADGQCHCVLCRRIRSGKRFQFYT